jgi:hypothetical protein
MNTSAKEFALAFYIDWVNNYLTIEKIAEHHGITIDCAKVLIEEGRSINTRQSQLKALDPANIKAAQDAQKLSEAAENNNTGFTTL